MAFSVGFFFYLHFFFHLGDLLVFVKKVVFFVLLNIRERSTSGKYVTLNGQLKELFNCKRREFAGGAFEFFKSSSFALRESIRVSWWQKICRKHLTGLVVLCVRMFGI